MLQGNDQRKDVARACCLQFIIFKIQDGDSSSGDLVPFGYSNFDRYFHYLLIFFFNFEESLVLLNQHERNCVSKSRVG